MTEESNGTSTSHNGHFDVVCILGLGLIGASLAASLRKAHPSTVIYGADTDPATCAEAVSRGWVDRALDPQDPQLRQLVCDQCDLVVIATPVPTVCDYLRLLAEWGYDGIITDTASTKAHISEEAQHLLPYPQNYLPGHPMAGSEKTGYANSTDILLENAYYLLTPSPENSPEDLTLMKELVRLTGANCVVLPAEDHDRITAAISHVPHIIAVTLVNMVRANDNAEENMKAFAAGGFKDITRIASSSPEMWQDICLANGTCIDDFLAYFQEQLKQFRQMIAQRNGAAIRHEFQIAGDYRNSIPAKKSSVIARAFDLFVNVDDRTGAIAEIATILSQKGISIKNIGIIHNREYIDGVMKLELYCEEDAVKARDLLEQNQYEIVKRD